MMIRKRLSARRAPKSFLNHTLFLWKALIFQNASPLREKHTFHKREAPFSTVLPKVIVFFFGGGGGGRGEYPLFPVDRVCMLLEKLKWSVAVGYFLSIG